MTPIRISTSRPSLRALEGWTAPWAAEPEEPMAPEERVRSPAVDAAAP